MCYKSNKPKIVLLCGGFGTRLSEETSKIPKPLVEIGGLPILHHIMNSYFFYGFQEVVIALGYKGDKIKQYFQNCGKDYRMINDGKVVKYQYSDYSVELKDTGIQTMTGGRLLRLSDELTDGTFMLTYGDCVSNININKLLDYHRSHGRIATVTAVKPEEKFGLLDFEGNKVTGFKEKIKTDNRWINGGFFVFEKGIFDYIEGDDTSLEMDVLDRVAKDNQLMAYKHDDFWACMDTLKDKRVLEDMWKNGNALWKTDYCIGGS